MTLRLTKLQLLYSTNYHGRSLEMFYNRVQRAKHSVMLREVQRDNSTSSGGKTESTIIGMYASQAWRVSPEVYGDGECFLFRLQPQPKVWKWHPSIRHQDDEDESKMTALLEQFMVGTRTFISMGGNPDGSSGLRLNEDLTVGESSPAVGFDNEPLHHVGGNKKGSVFSIGLVEVYSFVRQIGGNFV